MTGVKKKMHGKLELHSVSLPREMYTSNKKKCYILKDHYDFMPAFHNTH